MLKSTTWFLVFTILTVSITFPVTAQQVPTKEAMVPAAKKDASPADMKEVFAKQTAKVKADEAVFDPVKAERERGNQQAQTKGWSKTKKTLVIAAVVAGAAVLTFLLIKYYRKCLRYSETDCYYNSDTGIRECTCEEYEPRN